MIFRFFQDGGCPPSWICDERIWTTHEEHLVVFITVQNLVGINAVVTIICMFFDFTRLAGERLFTPQNCVFGGFDPLDGKTYQRNPQKAHPWAERRHTTYRSSKSRGEIWHGGGEVPSIMPNFTPIGATTRVYDPKNWNFYSD